MNEQLQKFVEWLPQNIEEFKDKSADEIAQILNQLSQTEEGKQQLNQLMEEFNSSVAQFRAGGKFSSFVKRFGNGGGILFAEDGIKYNRAAARKQKAGLLSDVTDDMGTYRVRNGGDQNVLAKKIKASNVDGFDPSMYNMDPSQEFDRDRYRQRKAIAREQHPGWTRRKRKAWALRDNDGPVNIDMSGIENLKPIPTNFKIPIPEFNEDVEAPDKVQLPNFNGGELEGGTTPDRVYRKRRHVVNIKPVSFDQFAGLLDDRLAASKAFKVGSDLQNFQYWRAKQYEEYVKDPLNYKYTDMQDGWVASDDDINRYRNSGLLTNRRMAGYYDPEAHDLSSKTLFTDKTINDVLTAKGYINGVRYDVVDENGNVVTDPDILQRFDLSNQPEYKKKVTVSVNKQNIAPIGESTFSRGMSNLVLSVPTTALALNLIGPMAQGMQATYPAIKDGAMWVGKKLATGASRFGNDVGNKLPQRFREMSHRYRWMNDFKNSINPKYIRRSRNAAGDFENGWTIDGTFTNKVFPRAKDAWNHLTRYWPNSQTVSTTVDTNRRIAWAWEPIMDKFGQMVANTPRWKLAIGGGALGGAMLGLEDIREENARARAAQRQPEIREDLYYNTTR